MVGMNDLEDAENDVQSTSQTDQLDEETADKYTSINNIDYSEDSTQLKARPYPMTHGRNTVH